MTTKAIKQTISQALGVQPKDLSVRVGGDTLSRYVLIQSRTVNLWEAADTLAEVFPSYNASSCVFATIDRSYL